MLLEDSIGEPFFVNNSSLQPPGTKIRFQFTAVEFRCAPVCEEYVEVSSFPLILTKYPGETWLYLREDRLPAVL